MPYTTLPSDGSTTKLTLKIPTKGSTNWDEVIKDDTFEKIAEHDHSGAGSGDKISVQNLKERGTLELSDTSSAFTTISSILDLVGTGGRGAIIEYVIKDSSNNTQTGILTAQYTDNSNYGLADEFLGDDLEVDFQLNTSGQLQYKAGAARTLYYFVKTIGVV